MTVHEIVILGNNDAVFRLTQDSNFRITGPFLVGQVVGVEDIMASLNKPGFQQIRQLGINEKLHASTFETVLTWVKRAA